MMKINNIVWSNRLLENIYLSVEEISNIKFQKKLWNAKIPNMISSYTEAMCSLFNDSFFDNFIDDYLKATNISVEFIEEVSLLREKLNSFDGNKMKHETIFKHPQWLEISEIATRVLSLWKKNDLPYTN